MKKIILLIVAVLAFENQAFSKIINQPYLQAIDTNSACVMVETDDEIKPFVTFGELETSLNLKASALFYKKTDRRVGGATFVYRVFLKDLKANTNYYYKALQNKEESKVYNFKTFPKKGQDFSFAWMSDLQTNPTTSQQITSLANKKAPIFSIMGGDLCGDKIYATWKEDFFTPKTNDLISHIPFFHLTGNHEGWNDNTKAFVEYPNNGDEKGYYSYDCGDLHVLVLNTDLALKEGSAQYSFAENDLKNSKAKWKIAVSHKPCYAYGSLHKTNEEMIILSKKVLSKYGVEMTISGHAHFYQHNKIDGIEQFIIASSGGVLVKPEKGEYTIKTAMGYAFGIINVSDKNLKLTVYNEKDEILDTYEISK